MRRAARIVAGLFLALGCLKAGQALAQSHADGAFVPGAELSPIAPSPGAIAPSPDSLVPSPITLASIGPAPDGIGPSPGAIAPSPGTIAPSPGGIAPSPGGIAPSPDAIAPSPIATPTPRPRALGSSRPIIPILPPS